MDSGPRIPPNVDRKRSEQLTSSSCLLSVQCVSTMIWLSGIAVIAGLLYNFSWALLLPVLLVLTYYKKNVFIICKTLRRDLRALKLVRQTNKTLKEFERKNCTILDLFEKHVEKNPDKPILYFEDQIWTFSDVDILSNKIANIFQEAGYKKGDAVALLMSNCVEYVCIWLGLAKLGVITALINVNLRNQPLVHCVNTAKVKAIIYSEEFDEAIEEISSQLESIKKYRWRKSEKDSSLSIDLASALEKASETKPIPETKIYYRDKILYVYTSGTTGLPKAAIIAHHRLLVMAVSLTYIVGIKNDDIVYNPLPLFHTSGGLLGVAGPLANGFSVVIRKKFSATAFWPDCIKYNCTGAQYIGEMCRYVLMVPSRPEDTQHKVRLIFGNGMKTAIWTEFKERFRLERICEIYGSTEGNTNLVSMDTTVGAVGFIPRILPASFLPLYLIKVDELSEPIRNSKGFCIRCEPNEPGMLIGMITSTDPTREYFGYVGDSKENDKKVIENVFKKGDRAFLTGDILVMDDLGYLFFKDRTGDTFKWKSENVSTAEVEGIVSSAAGLRDVLVYGVEVGNLEGKAGMATIVDPENKVDLQGLTKEIDKNLPPYARPLFLRFTDHVDMTGTFKLKKLDFQKEGFNPEKVRDKLYFKNGKEGYVVLTKQIHDDILSGKIRV